MSRVEGKFIVLEGIDTGLLSALSGRLCRWLQGLGLAVEQTSEPTYGPVGAQIRLAEQGRLALDPRSLALLWVAERLDHLRRDDGILAWRAEGRQVLCTHYRLYSYARQGRQDVDWDWLRRADALCDSPDLTLYVDTPPSAVRDAPAAEVEPLYRGYAAAIERLRSEGERIERVDGRGTLDEIERTCQGHLAYLLDLPPAATSERGEG